MYHSLFSFRENCNLIAMSKFGISLLKDYQFEAMQSLHDRQHTFCIVPTGGGKSLIYQLFSQMEEKITIVISPLLSLIKDQIRALKLKNIGCLHFHDNSEFEWNAQETIFEKLSTKLVYLTPEMFHTSRFNSFLTILDSRNLINIFVIDECHCVVDWGDDFRPTYKHLLLSQNFPNIPVLLLTGTASPLYQKHIIATFNLKDVEIIQVPTTRDNLSYTVLRKYGHSKYQLSSIINKFPPRTSGIVYCRTKKETETISNQLLKSDIISKPYHAGLPLIERMDTQDKWMSEIIPIVVATTAFGMGIDKHNVRFVIHTSPSYSIENYLQESGRAGRDREPSHCILLYNYMDIKKTKSMILKDQTLLYESRRQKMIQLRCMQLYCTNITNCRKLQLLGFLQEPHNNKPLCVTNGICDNCKAEKNSFDITKMLQVLNENKEELINLKVNFYVLADILTGFVCKYTESEKHSKLKFFGSLCNWHIKDVEFSLFHLMLSRGIEFEQCEFTKEETLFRIDLKNLQSVIEKRSIANNFFSVN